MRRGAVAAGVDGIVIDWERRGKHVRQHGADTEVNEDTVAIFGAYVRPCRACPRPDQCVDWRSSLEIEERSMPAQTTYCVPMIRRPEDVELALELAAGRLGVGILVETSRRR